MLQMVKVLPRESNMLLRTDMILLDLCVMQNWNRFGCKLLCFEVENRKSHLQRLATKDVERELALDGMALNSFGSRTLETSASIPVPIDGCGRNLICVAHSNDNIQIINEQQYVFLETMSWLLWIIHTALFNWTIFNWRAQHIQAWWLSYETSIHSFSIATNPY